MGTQYLNTQIRLKRGLAEAWARNNPILAKGEPGWATDTKVLKIGDGETHWNDLSYVINVSDYVTEEELRAAIEKYDAQIREWLEGLAVNVDAAFEDIYQAIGEFAADVEQRFTEIDGAIEEATNAGRAYTDAKAEGLGDAIGAIGNTVQSHDVQLKQSIQPMLEQHSDTLDRLVGSVNYVNCLKHYNPELIKMEYTNKAGGWKASIKDKNTSEEIHGASLFSRHQVEGWDEHSVEFVNGRTTDATFQIYSVSKEPGVIQVDDVKIEELSGNGLYYDPQCGPSDFSNNSDIWVWPASWACTLNNNQAVISITKPTWSSYVNGNLALVPGSTYYVDINIALYTSGGTNFSIKDSAGTKINLLDLNGKKRTSKYLSAAGTTRLYFVAPGDGRITLYFGGSGDQLDNLTIGSCVVYQSNSTRWALTSPLLDNAWVQPEDWYTWGKEVDYEGQRVMRFSTSEEKQYWYTKQRTLTLNTRTHYRLSFRAKCVSGGLNIHVKDSNNKTIVRQTVSAETAPEWTNFDFSFVPTTENCTLQIQALGDQSLLYNVYISNLDLRPISPAENILRNGYFSNDKYVGGTHYIGRANWTLGKASSIVDGTAQLAVPLDNSLTYVSGCSQGITLIPGNRYRVSFRSKSISCNPVWMPYITFTNEDKIAFVSDIDSMGYETLRLGGPWVNGAAEHYAARVSIQGGSPLNIKYVYFLGAVYGSNEFEVDVKIKDSNGETVYAQQHRLISPVLGDVKKYYLELPTDFQFHGGHIIELTFMVNEIQRSQYPNVIYGAGIVGNYKDANHQPQPDYRIDPNGRIYMEELRAGRVIANIDDGSLDWEV